VSPTPLFKLDEMYHSFPVQIEHGEMITLCFECDCDQQGSWRDLFVFDFDNGGYQLGRFLTVEGVSNERKKSGGFKYNFLEKYNIYNNKFF